MEKISNHPSLQAAANELHFLTKNKVSFAEQQRLNDCLLEGYSIDKAARWVNMFFMLSAEALAHSKKFTNGYYAQCAYDDYYNRNEHRLLSIQGE